MHLCKNLANSQCNAMAMKYEFELELMAAYKNHIYLPTNPNTYPELLEYLCSPASKVPDDHHHPQCAKSKCHCG